MEKLMENKVGIVTASGSGIGRASALAFAAEGAKVIVSDINESAGAETVRLIKEAGGEATFIKCDVGNEEEVKSLVAKTVETYGGLDWAHNNAGVSGPTVPITETQNEHWDKTMKVDLTGLFYSLKYEIPALIKSGGGAIVNTASTAGLTGVYGLSAYSSAKWAVNGLTKTAALENGKHGIRVNSICPGMTLTPSVESWSSEVPEQAKQVEAAIPLGRLGKPEDQANAAVWLCSDKAGYITGINLAVDGGQTAQ
ncbi:glucose 1-dehydrogenase [Bacillus sp. SD088]|uniref:glucose 1-dehydrogenase n=1 Tax=Bacillus sp. SD088 TaxID=2782012 RepID=UPI001A96AD71|nr:glucose 1-dehydrogenase [Bacillus sp. SD088]MBO0993553.1 glucose 1-dehydrogenase [Bacillus sp. SD088]